MRLSKPNAMTDQSDAQDEDREQFAQLIGYSVSGFGDLSYATNRIYNRASRQSAALLKEKP